MPEHDTSVLAADQQGLAALDFGLRLAAECWRNEVGPSPTDCCKRLECWGCHSLVWRHIGRYRYISNHIDTCIYMPLKNKYIHFRSIVLSTQIPWVHNLPQMIPRIGSKSPKLIQSQLPIGGLFNPWWNHGSSMVKLRITYGLPMDSYGKTLVFRWKNMVFLWKTMVFLWIPW